MAIALRVALLAAATSSFASAYVPVSGLNGLRAPFADLQGRCERGRSTMTLAVSNSNNAEFQPQASNAAGEELLKAVAAKATKARTIARCAACSVQAPVVPLFQLVRGGCCDPSAAGALRRWRCCGGRRNTKLLGKAIPEHWENGVQYHMGVPPFSALASAPGTLRARGWAEGLGIGG
ncbi:hypothetical protein T484DRAFT_1752617 [Baffinella frigidus]|nr:hypothetical protein T484DRAFT_1752617 [Cryptophyta sp. CCMP2293]